MTDATPSSDPQHQAFWHSHAEQALDAFDLSHARLMWLGYTHNAVFKVLTNTQTYVLRLLLAQQNPLTTLHAQLAWLNNLPDTVPAQRGAYPIPRDCTRTLTTDPPLVATLFQHIEGDTLTPDALTPHTMTQIAQFIARLHQSQPTDAPDVAMPLLTYEGLFGQLGRYAIPPDTFTPAQNAIIDRALTRVDATMQALNAIATPDAPTFGYLHGDLLTKNMLRHADGRIFAIDFEYAGWGCFLYDLTPLLWQLKPDTRYPSLASAFWRAYQDAMPWHVGTLSQLETLIAGRQIASLRWLALNRHNPAITAQFPQLISHRLAELDVFCETGTLSRT